MLEFPEMYRMDQPGTDYRTAHEDERDADGSSIMEVGTARIKVAL